MPKNKSRLNEVTLLQLHMKCTIEIFLPHTTPLSDPFQQGTQSTEGSAYEVGGRVEAEAVAEEPTTTAEELLILFLLVGHFWKEIKGHKPHQSAGFRRINSYRAHSLAPLKLIELYHSS